MCTPMRKQKKAEKRRVTPNSNSQRRQTLKTKHGGDFIGTHLSVQKNVTDGPKHNFKTLMDRVYFLNHFHKTPPPPNDSTTKDAILPNSFRPHRTSSAPLSSAPLTHSPVLHRHQPPIHPKNLNPLPSHHLPNDLTFLNRLRPPSRYNLRPSQQ